MRKLATRVVLTLALFFTASAHASIELILLSTLNKWKEGKGIITAVKISGQVIHVYFDDNIKNNKYKIALSGDDRELGKALIGGIGKHISVSNYGESINIEN